MKLREATEKIIFGPAEGFQSGGRNRVTQKRFFKYGHVIYRWKRILMLISDFKEFFQNFHFWAQSGAAVILKIVQF